MNIALLQGKLPVDEISFNISLITPKLAQAMLESSLGNRAIRGWYVDVLANAIKRGEWSLTNQGIAFDKYNHLIDGHHRLLACIQANIPITVICVYGISQEGYDAIDQGINRKVYDVLAIDKRIAQPLRLAASYAFSQQKLTMQQIRKMQETDILVSISELVEYSGTSRRGISAAPVKLGAALQMLNYPSTADWIKRQYKAACLLKFDEMCNHMQYFCKWLSINVKRNTNNGLLAMSLHVFDKSKENNKRVLGKSSVEFEIEYARRSLQALLNKG